MLALKPAQSYLKFMNKTTKITGKTATTCTGKSARYTVGQMVYIQVHTMAPEGGALSGVEYGKIVRIGLGTEYGMIGLTAICEIQLSSGIKSVAARTIR